MSAADGTGPAVEITGLVKRYGAVTAVAGIDLRVDRGTVVALLGPNGAGKTTTIEVCEGYRRADAGRVRVLGLDPIADHDRLTPRVGVMLQSGGIYPGARAIEMLRLMASFAAHPLDVAALAGRLGVDEYAAVPYRRLSGGQRQRLALAMALVGRPELVFLDEPSAGLDPQARRATWDLVGELRGDGVAVVLTTHFMDEAERLADHVVIIDRGAIVATGSPGQLVTAVTGGEGEQMCFTSEPALDLDRLRTTLPPGVLVTEPTPGDYVLRGNLVPTVLAAVTAWAADNGVRMSDLRTGRRTLEDVFLELTGRELRG